MKNPIWGNRRGTEPTEAKSPLALRRVIALLGLILAAIAFIAFWATDNLSGLMIGVLAVLAAVSVIDATVVQLRMRRRSGGAAN